MRQGDQLLERFVQDDRVCIRRPHSSQQIQFNRTLGSGNNFVSFVDAIGELDGTPCVLEWKTSSARYPEEPAGISALDPPTGLLYSWMTGIHEVAQIVFSCARGWSKFSTSGPPFLRNNGRSLQPSLMTRSDGSSPDCSCHIAASAFRKIRAQRVLLSSGALP